MIFSKFEVHDKIQQLLYILMRYETIIINFCRIFYY